MFIARSELVEQFDDKLYDFAISKIDIDYSKEKSSHTILVDIDEKSLQALGQWPWPRVMLADLVQKIENYHPATIGLDIIFPEKDRTSPVNMNAFYSNYFHIRQKVISIDNALADNDIIFAKVLRATQSVVGIDLSRTPVGYLDCNLSSPISSKKLFLHLNNYDYALCNTPIIQNNVLSTGFVNAMVDSDGVVRRMPLLASYKGVVVPSFALALLMDLDPGMKIEGNKFFLLDHILQTDEDSSYLLRFYKNNWYKKISAIDILRGNIDSKMLQGKIVVVGSSAVGLHDKLIRSGGINTIGAQIHMTMIDNLIYNDMVREPMQYKYLNIVVSTFATLLLLFLLIKNKNIFMVTLIITLFVSYAFFTYFMLKSGIYISAGYFYIPFMLNFIFISISFMIIDSYKKRLYSEELDRSHVALLDSMVHVAEVHDIETGAHIIRTKKYIKLLAEHIFAQPHHPYRKYLSKLIIEMMYRTAPLHDIGKVGIPDSVLKKPGKLTMLEYEVMKTHPDLGRHIIKNAMESYEENDFFIMATNIAYTHHEKWDGSGYPEGLKGEEIPLEGRFMAIADVYDALVNKRVYKKAFSYEETYRVIQEGRGTHFDPLLVDAFFEIKNAMKEIAELYEDDTEM